MSTLDYCLNQARQIPFVKDQHRVYSCVVSKRGKIVSESPNLYTKSHPKQKHYSVRAGLSEFRCYLHSELRSIIIAAKKNPKNCKLIVARVGAKGAALDAYPCQTCRMAIKECGFIDSIEFSIGKC